MKHKPKRYYKQSRRTILFITLLFISLGLYSQEENNNQKVWIMGVPQHLFNNGIRIETDLRLKGDKNHWIVIAPAFYYRDKPGNFYSERWDTEGMEGAGINLYYRRYMTGESETWYLSAGGGYRWVNYKMKGYRWNEFRENDLTFYVYDDDNYNVSYSTMKADAMIGFRMVPDPNFAMDVYSGFGFRYTHNMQPDNIYKPIGGDGMNNSGFVFLLGIRIGVGW
ncbi:MAG: hypothetical protein ACLFQS_08810 [Bacteroidales bacterium]